MTAGMDKAVAGGEREQREGASGKWVAHWKMVHIVRPVWEKVGAGQPARPRLPAADLHRGGRGRPDPAGAGAPHRPRRPRPAERGPAVRQRLRPGLPGGGAQAGRLLRQRRRALPHGGHGHRRDPPEHPLGVAAQGRHAHRGRSRDRAPRRATCSTPELFDRLLDEEYDKLLAAGNRDVHDVSKTTTLPIAREIVAAYVTEPRQGALVHRSAEPQPEQPRPGGGPAAHPPVPGRVPPRRHADHREPGLHAGQPVAADAGRGANHEQRSRSR